jgi:hypothetical protein
VAENWFPLPFPPSADHRRTLEDGIAFAETVLKDSRRGFLGAEVKNLRTLEVLWTSAPVLQPGGVR